MSRARGVGSRKVGNVKVAEPTDTNPLFIRGSGWRSGHLHLLSSVYNLEINIPRQRTNAMSFRTHLRGRQPLNKGETT